MAQQEVDTTLVPQITTPFFKKDEGPTVFIDELHNNFHTKEDRFKPFSTLLERDGYQVKSLTTYKLLHKTDVLVISNAINSQNLRNWQQPIYDAFSSEDIQTLKTWVEQGGRLLIIADHMPFSGATNTLANAFGFDFCDGFAQLSKPEGASDIFSEENNRLLVSKITDGTYGKSIHSVTTFMGSSFQKPEKAIGILKFKKGDVCEQPEIAWQFEDDTPSKDLEDSYQGAIMNFGKGKLAVFGEAAQFTAQTITNEDGVFHVGFNSETAPNNIDFLRNLMLWLSASESKK
ncbi:DUF4350 domain-containing protein [Psychroserpens damuponensis]|uniref:DUF4350 domain-containing protein n=1 Tax=Psychroserpens damuponensis TaxID=943936 RepID=UPI000694D969|nr:DUF4350 domain-containing protein [Psychroserpens damuponensis]